jgi:hypothetical protein
MPIQDRQPETDGYLTSHPVKVTRPGGIEDGMYAPSPSVLLSPGTPTLQAPVPAPARALALDALRLIRLLRDPARRPERWQQPSFGEEVELIRRHLAPVRSRRTLAASYAGRHSTSPPPCPTTRTRARPGWRTRSVGWSSAMGRPARLGSPC